MVDLYDAYESKNMTNSLEVIRNIEITMCNNQKHKHKSLIGKGIIDCRHNQNYIRFWADLEEGNLQFCNDFPDILQPLQNVRDFLQLNSQFFGHFPTKFRNFAIAFLLRMRHW